jgi:phosphotriesterase-related protein
MATVDTALGPIATTALGPTLMHEHIVTRSPGVHENWPHLFDRPGILAAAERKMADLYQRGIRTIVDLTTVDLGRDIGLIVDVARRARVHVIVATGVWWMPQRYFGIRGAAEVADLFIRDLTQGIGGSGVKASIIKCATDTQGVTPVIETILRASARAQLATGAPISTHTWAAGRTGEAQQAIFAQEGVDLRRVIIGHSGDSEDLGYLRGLMDRGSTIGMDRFGLEHLLPNAKRVDVIARLCAEGYADRMVLSHTPTAGATPCPTPRSSARARSGTTTTSPTTSCPPCARPGSATATSTRCSCAIPARSSRPGAAGSEPRQARATSVIL